MPTAAWLCCQLLAAGSVLAAAEVALLASQGVASVQVHRRPRVGSVGQHTPPTHTEAEPALHSALNGPVLLPFVYCAVLCCAVLCCAVSSVLSSGDELVDCTAAECPAGCVRDSNRPLLLSLLSRDGCADVHDLGIVRDSEAGLTSLLSPALLRSLDAVVCTGGVSMGELDLLKDWLSARGRLLFGRVNMKPGKPTTFAVLHRQADDGSSLPPLPFFALPGNPVSAFATCHLFVLPALQRMRGAPLSALHLDSGYPRCTVAVVGGVQRDAHRVDYQRCTVYSDVKRGRLVAVSTGAQLSSRLMSATSANALLVLQPGSESVAHGDTVEALLIDRVRPIEGAQLSAIVAQAARTRHEQQPSGQQPHSHHSHHSYHQRQQQQHSHGNGHSVRSESGAVAEASVSGAVSLSRVTIGVAVVTVSDRVASGQSEDKSGPAIEQLLQQYSSRHKQSVALRHARALCT